MATELIIRHSLKSSSSAPLDTEKLPKGARTVTR